MASLVSTLLRDVVPLPLCARGPERDPKGSVGTMGVSRNAESQ